MRLLYAPASPYSAKVRMAAAFAGIPLEAEVTDTNAMPAALLNANPLGKIPVLIADDGGSVFDSRAIMRHLDRLAGGGLYPADAPGDAERLEALADGMCDCLLAHVYERRMRPAEKVHEPWVERQWKKAMRALDALEASLPPPAAPDAGRIALRAALGYLALRFGGHWEEGRPGLLGWAERFDAAHPALAELLPA
jgi:glutathione S-transferase